MNSVQAKVSFEERRVVMKKVEHMVAEAEALNKTRDLRREEVHVSDASSSESENEFAAIPNVSPVLNIGCAKSSSQESLGSLGGDLAPRLRNRHKTTPRLAFTDELELEALNATPRTVSRPGIQRPSPQDKPPNGSVPLSAKLDRSVASTSNSATSTPSRMNDTATSINLYRGGGGPVSSICSAAKLDRSIASAGKSVMSKISSTNSNGTPTLYRGVPVNSPPFSVESPGVATTPEPILAVSTASSRKNLLNMKQEIDDLTAEFETLGKQRTKKRNSASSCKRTNFKEAEKAFEEGLDTMGRKTVAVIDALHKNVSHSQILNRDNDRLRGHVQNLSKSKTYTSPSTPDNRGNLMGDDNEVSILGPEQTVDHLDPSNAYVKRRYPAVATTPGTMFVSEIVEVLNLDVGEHTYLSDIMNRQWGVTP